MGACVSATSKTLMDVYREWLGGQDARAMDGPIAEASRVLEHPGFEGEPFLSVICRTQGERIEELREALASLRSQGSRDFELIVVCHNAASAAVERVRALVRELDDWLVERTTLMAVEGGSRARPLNAALPRVRGRYFSSFDEDDIVYPNWVSAFKRLASAGAAGAGGVAGAACAVDAANSADVVNVLYCFVESQRWSVEKGPGDERVLIPTSDAIGVEYCRHPNELRLLVGNQCPFMGLAFPAELSRIWGLRFSEGLETMEDWDFFLRARNVYPLISSEERVALYRLWSEKGGNSSDTVAMSRWRDDAALVGDSLDAMPLLFAPGASVGVRELVGAGDAEAGFLASQITLFVDDGGGFTAENSMTPRPDSDERGAFVFEELERFGELVMLRVDPADHGPLALAGYGLRVHLADGTAFDISPADTVTNARVVEGQYEFPGDDPQILFPLPYRAVVSKAVFRFERACGFIADGEIRSSWVSY